MSEGVIEPTAVYRPGNAPATVNRERFYDTYNTRTLGGDQSGYNPFPETPVRGPGRVYGIFQRLPGGSQPVTVPKQVPSFLAQRSVIFFMWGLAMIMVSLDEWHTHHALPRPPRLWYTSLTYFLLAAASAFDPVVPLATALAIGLTLAVTYQYYTGSGDFGNYGANEAGTTPAPNATGGTAGGGTPAPKAA